MYKLYSEKKFLIGSCHMLVPFWGNNKNNIDIDDCRFDNYIEEGKKIFELSSLEESDFIIFPAEPKGKEFIEFQQISKDKPLIAFFNNDSDENLNYRDNTYIFRTSFYKSTQKQTEFAVPGWSNDLGSLPIRKWSNKPTVSFCGQVVNPRNVRLSGLEILEKNKHIDTKFIKRNLFWAGCSFQEKDKDLAISVRKEFLDNINNSDYVFCARGGGNFSYRIYETMACGRIPLLLNTDCVLPYDFIVDWGKIFPIINLKEINKIPEFLLEFHNSIKDSFEERQILIRQLWEKYISPTGFFKNIDKHFMGVM